MLNTKAFGLACGILWALCVLALAASSTWLNFGTEFAMILATLYKGYAPTIPGAIIGAVWGFLDAGICGWVLALLYNTIARRV